MASDELVETRAEDVVDGCWRWTRNELLDIDAVEKRWILENSLDSKQDDRASRYAR